MARYDTAANILNRAAAECGLQEVSAPFSSSDQNYKQLVRLLTTTGLELCGLRRWQHLSKIHTITTANGDGRSYDLPDDFMGVVDGTGWDRTQEFPLLGPFGPQEWAQIQAETTSSTFAGWRVIGDQIVIDPSTVADGTVFAFEYRSRYWVQPNGETTGTTDAPTAADDTLLFEPILLIRALKYHFLSAKGFDTTSAARNYQIALEMAAGLSEPSPVIRIGGRTDVAMVGVGNLPRTDWGS